MINCFVNESLLRLADFFPVRDDSEDSILPSSSNIYPRFILILFYSIIPKQPWNFHGC